MAVNRTPIQINTNLLNMITPWGAEFKRNIIYWGENCVKIYAIIKYSPTLPLAWASKISNLPNVILCQVVESCDNNTLVLDLSRSITKYRGEAEATRDPLEQHKAEKRANDAQSIMEQINDNNGTIGFMTNTIMVFGKTEEQLETACRRLESTVSSLGCRLRLLPNQQQEGLTTVSPYNLGVENILKQARRNVPMTTFLGGFPFSSNGFIDDKGYSIGTDSQGGLIAIDLWKRGDDRTNSNMVVVGLPGQGKSALIKNIMIKERMMGTVCISIDPEREVRELAENTDGDIIYAGGGEQKINPLQIKTVPTDVDDEKGEKLFDGGKVNPLSLHLKSLEIFFKLYIPEITSTQLALLEQVLTQLYRTFDIDWSTDLSNFKNTDYPIFTDLFNLILKLEESKSVDKSFEKDMQFLKLMIHKLAHGSDKFLWNGNTTMESDSKFIVLDTHDLQEQSNNVKKAQYYIVLTWAWERMSRNRQEKVLLFCDEAYLLIDPQVPQSLSFLRNVSKRARKYEAGLCVISHSVIDFLDPSVRMYGQQLLDSPTYKFLMGADGQNLKDLAYLYNLTEAEQEILASTKRGRAIFMVGSKRFVANIKIRDENFKRMGVGGGK